MLEFGRQIAFEVVLDDEDVEEIGIAAGAEDVPRKGGETEAADGDGVKAADGVAPTLGEEGPEKDSAAGENDGRGTFGESGEAEEKTKQN